MNPQEQVCHNDRCWVYGRSGEGHIVIHSQREQRYRCKRCGKTFSATMDTPFYRLHTPHALVMIVVTLLAYGCPVRADCCRLSAGRTDGGGVATAGRAAGGTSP